MDTLGGLDKFSKAQAMKPLRGAEPSGGLQRFAGRPSELNDRRKSQLEQSGQRSDSFAEKARRGEYGQLKAKRENTINSEEDSDLLAAQKAAAITINPVLDVVTCRSPHLRWLHDVEGKETEHFNMVVGVVILFNAIVIGLETDLGEDEFVFFEHFFCIFFLCEMGLKIYAMTFPAYIVIAWNMFDFTLVVLGTLDLYVLSVLMPNAKGGAVGMLRLLRMLRVARILRLFKVLHSLSIILSAFLKAFSAVFWVSLLTIILMYVLAVFLTQTVGHKYYWWDGRDADKVKDWFGTIGHSMRSLFIIMTLAEWDEMSLVLSKKVNPLIVFGGMIWYIMVAAFTMVSLITGIIGEALIRAQDEDDANREQVVEEEKNAFIDDLSNFLKNMDDDGDGTLSKRMLEKKMDGALGDEIDRKFKELEIKAVSRDDLMNIVERLAQRNEEEEEASCLQDGQLYQEGAVEPKIKITDFVEAMHHLKGNARASSMWDLKFNVTGLKAETLKSTEILDEAFDTLRKIHTRMKKQQK